MTYTTDEQPMPQVNDQPHIHDLVMADIAARKALGLERYGTPLQAHNGRDALKDAYEEVLDLACYVRQLIVERETKIEYCPYDCDHCHNDECPCDRVGCAGYVEPTLKLV